jgi:hypothetical protein
VFARVKQPPRTPAAATELFRLFLPLDLKCVRVCVFVKKCEA